ncbi:MAG: helix-turn-helix transcriptional regulator [Lachnospiraceae bacterium]|nr:helix-turn-helix transcriptional regulator [Lachnospiraceae bacterium]
MKTELLPDRLITIREQQGLNKSQAATLIGLSPIGYLRYEQGLRLPSPQMLEIIALKLNTSVDYLTGATDDPSADQLLISRKENQELFEILMEFQSGNSAATERLLTYATKLNKKLITQ